MRRCPTALGFKTKPERNQLEHLMTLTVQIDSAHCRAICEEIGSRLRQSLQNSRVEEYAPHSKLLDRLREKELVRRDAGGEASVASSFGEIGSRDGAHRSSTPLRR